MFGRKKKRQASARNSPFSFQLCKKRYLNIYFIALIRHRLHIYSTCQCPAGLCGEKCTWTRVITSLWRPPIGPTSPESFLSASSPRLPTVWGESEKADIWKIEMASKVGGKCHTDSQTKFKIIICWLGIEASMCENTVHAFTELISTSTFSFLCFLLLWCFGPWEVFYLFILFCKQCTRCFL